MELRTTQLIESVFVGGGEMGARMCALTGNAVTFKCLEPSCRQVRRQLLLGRQNNVLSTNKAGR
jgi:hypothetical protein